MQTSILCVVFVKNNKKPLFIFFQTARHFGEKDRRFGTPVGWKGGEDWDPDLIVDFSFQRRINEALEGDGYIPWSDLEEQEGGGQTDEESESGLEDGPERNSVAEQLTEDEEVVEASGNDSNNSMEGIEDEERAEELDLSLIHI